MRVFAWLSARQLAAAGAACRAWRRAAAAPPLWRRLLLRAAPPAAPALLQLPHPVNWRQEYVDTRAGWNLRAREPLGGGALHAALEPGGARLALVGDDASLQVWARAAAARGWALRWRAALAARGWRGAVRSHWAPAAGRLLVLGAHALVDSWELLVLHFDEEGEGRVAASARCSAGAGGCWADAAGDAFLSLELSLLAPRLACTTVWLNAASQETQSEYAGVRTPLLRIFNENGAHITFAAVAQVPLETAGTATLGVLVTACGAGAATSGGALAAWPLTALRPPPVLAAELGDLRERVRRRAARPPPPVAEPPPPDEETVRALCTSPEAMSALPAAPVGFLVHPNGRCVWVSLSGGGAWCAGLPDLSALRYLPPPAPSPAPDPAMIHYIQSSVSNAYFVSPRGSHGGDVCVWRVRSGAVARAPPAHPAPALVALLSPALPDATIELLVLTGEYLYTWCSCSTAQPADESLQMAPPPPSPRPPPHALLADPRPTASSASHPSSIERTSPVVAH